MMSTSLTQQNNPMEKPLSLFRKAFFHSQLHKLWEKLTHTRSSLIDLDETLKGHPAENSYYGGVKTVSIDHIRGTQGKKNEFDAEFNPTQERSRSRWMDIALQKLRGRELPPVDLIQINDIYYVRDGHHRISVSRAMGQAYIDAEVTIMRILYKPPLLLNK